MEQTLFREIYKQVHQRHCLFQKPILAFLCQCSHAHKTCIAEREGIKCQDDKAQQQCIDFLEVMEKKGRFSAKLTQGNKQSYSGHIRLQMGSLRGIRALLDTQAIETMPIQDVYTLIADAKIQFKDLTQLPFERILPFINRYQGRKRRGKK